MLAFIEILQILCLSFEATSMMFPATVNRLVDSFTSIEMIPMGRVCLARCQEMVFSAMNCFVVRFSWSEVMDLKHEQSGWLSWREHFSQALFRKFHARHSEDPDEFPRLSDASEQRRYIELIQIMYNHLTT